MLSFLNYCYYEFKGLYAYTMIIIFIWKKKHSWNTCALVFHSNEKFEAFKEVLHSSAFQWSWFSYYLEEIYICTVNPLAVRFHDCPIYINFLKSIHVGEGRELITRSISIIHRHYKWKLFIPYFFYFETETILNNDLMFRVNWFSQRIFENLPLNHEIWEK